MKKLKLTNLVKLVIAIGFVMIVFNGCKKDDKKETSPVIPKISFISNSGFVSSNKTVFKGSTIKIGALVKNATRYKIISSSVATKSEIIILDSTFTNIDTIVYNIPIINTQTLNFTTYNGNNIIQNSSLIITVSQYNAINTYKTVMLGDQYSTYPCFLTMYNGKTYNCSTINIKDSLIDLCCFKTQAYPNHMYFCSTSYWNNLGNVPYFIDTTSTYFCYNTNISASQDFDKLQNDSLITDITSTTDFNNYIDINQLGINSSVYYFITHNGKKGMIKNISNINDNIIITIKVQK